MCTLSIISKSQSKVRLKSTMADSEGNRNLYKTPPNEILRHRKKFYGLTKRCDDTASWMSRLQSQISRCEFPPVLSREFLLIDRFVCELTDNETEFLRRTNTWTLMELTEYLIDRNISTNRDVVSCMNISLFVVVVMIRCCKWWFGLYNFRITINMVKLALQAQVMSCSNQNSIQAKILNRIHCKPIYPSQMERTKSPLRW